MYRARGRLATSLFERGEFVLADAHTAEMGALLTLRRADPQELVVELRGARALMVGDFDERQ